MSEKKPTNVMSNAQFKAMINKKVGEGTIFSLEKAGETVQVEPASTGVPSLDLALGIGGLPLGRMVEIYGLESAGKTTISLLVIAAYQRSKKRIASRADKKVVFFDMEHSLDPIHARNLGVDISEETGMMVAQPETGENMYDLMDSMLDMDEVGIMIVDSVPSILPKAVIEASAEDNHMAVAARLNGKMIPQLVKKAHKNNVLLIFINQIRSTMSMYGSRTNNLLSA